LEKCRACQIIISLVDGRADGLKSFDSWGLASFFPDTELRRRIQNFARGVMARLGCEACRAERECILSMLRLRMDLSLVMAESLTTIYFR